MSIFHGKTVGKIQKWLGEFTINHCQRVLHSDAFKENHSYLCGLRNFQDSLHVRGLIVH